MTMAWGSDDGVFGMEEVRERFTPTPMKVGPTFLHPALSAVILVVALGTCAALKTAPFGDADPWYGLGLVALSCLAVMGGLTPKRSF